MKALILLPAAAAAALALTAGAEAKPRPRWEIGIGGGASYSPDYWGSENSTLSGFPLAYFIYRGENFSIAPNGLFDLAAYDTSRFSFSALVDFQGSIDPEDRLGLPKIDFVGEIGPEIELALYADGTSRLQVSVAARAAFEWENGYVGYVIEPELAFMTSLTEDTRIGFTATPKFGFDGYNQLYYSTPGFNAEDGYIGTELALRFVSDLTDRIRLAGKVSAITVSGSEIEDSPLVTEEWGYAARLSISYALWQSDEMVNY